MRVSRRPRIPGVVFFPFDVPEIFREDLDPKVFKMLSAFCWALFSLSAPLIPEEEVELNDWFPVMSPLFRVICSASDKTALIPSSFECNPSTLCLSLSKLLMAASKSPSLVILTPRRLSVWSEIEGGRPGFLKTGIPDGVA